MVIFKVTNRERYFQTVIKIFCKYIHYNSFDHFATTFYYLSLHVLKLQKCNTHNRYTIYQIHTFLSKKKYAGKYLYFYIQKVSKKRFENTLFIIFEFQVLYDDLILWNRFLKSCVLLLRMISNKKEPSYLTFS